MGINEEGRRARFGISESGTWFKPEMVELMQEAAKDFADQGLQLEVLGDQLADGTPKMDLDEYRDMVGVRVIPGPDMRDLAPFWGRVNALQIKRALGRY